MTLASTEPCVALHDGFSLANAGTVIAGISNRRVGGYRCYD